MKVSSRVRQSPEASAFACLLTAQTSGKQRQAVRHDTFREEETGKATNLNVWHLRLARQECVLEDRAALFWRRHRLASVQPITLFKERGHLLKPGPTETSVHSIFRCPHSNCAPSFGSGKDIFQESSSARWENSLSIFRNANKPHGLLQRAMPSRANMRSTTLSGSLAAINRTFFVAVYPGTGQMSPTAFCTLPEPK